MVGGLEHVVFSIPPDSLDFHQQPAPNGVSEAAPKATRRLLEDCCAQRLRDRRFGPVTALMAVLGGGDLGDATTWRDQGEKRCGKITEVKILDISDIFRHIQTFWIMSLGVAGYQMCCFEMIFCEIWNIYNEHYRIYNC